MSQPFSQPSYFPSHALDHAFAGIGAGVVAVLCMHPLDLLKVKFQVATEKPVGSIGQQIWLSLKGIQRNEGWRGLYRGVGPNIAGNASSWGLYFLFYNDLKRRATNGGTGPPLSAGQYLLYSAEASAATAIITNPIWVVKVRMFTSRADNPTAYRGLWDGLRSVYRSEGISGLYRGTLLALVGVSNGALQFMMYEEMKRWGFERKRRRMQKEGKEYTPADDHLSNTSYTIMSGASKLAALTITYPYQVIRSRMQNTSTSPLPSSIYNNSTITSTIKSTWKNEGTRGFYRGLGTNLVRVLPGTCVTFVVYENLAYLLKTAAARREKRKE